MSQKMASAHKHSGWVGFILAGTRKIGVSSGWSKTGNIVTVVSTSENTGASNKTSTQVFDDVSVQVWHDHNIKLPWIRDQLHTSVINNHIFVFYSTFVLLSNSVTSSHKQTITL